MLKRVSQGVVNSLFIWIGISVGLDFGVSTVSAQTRTLLRNQTGNQPPRLNVIHVNPVLGNDLTGKGTIQSPFRSITNALLRARLNTTIKLASGTYTVANGEVFPLQLKSGITIQGNEANQGRDTVILGGGDFISPTLASKNITILGADASELRGVAVTNRNSRGYGLWIEGTSPRIIGNTFRGSTQDGVAVLGKSTALISKNIFTTNTANGISIEGMAQPEVNGNRFENTGYGIVVRKDASPRLLNNAISYNRSGILVQSGSSPILRSNVIERNRQTGVIILANSSPDLGNVNSAGNNIIRNNLQRDVQYTGTNAIAAVGNQILRISGNLQLSGTVQVNATRLPSPSLITPINPSNPNTVRTVLPNSVIVRSTLPAESAQPLPANTSIDSSLQPIALAPPSGASLNRNNPNRNNPNRNNPIRTNIPVAIPPSGTNINSPINGTTINGNRTILITRAQPSAFTPAPIPSIPTPVLRYRVVVPTNAASKVEIRRIVPTAFTARMNGQEVIQVGAYSDRTAANEQVKLLAQAGFNAEIESINPQ